MGSKLEFNKSRRCFLKGASGAALSIPFLESLAPSEVLAQTAFKTKRLITVRTQNGELLREWYPQILPDKVIAPDVKTRSLTGVPGPISNLIGPEFDAFKT